MPIPSDIHSMLAKAHFELGRYLGMAEAMEPLHTCKMQHLRYPWPLDPTCDGCRQTLEKYVKRLHLEIPYRLFGWDCVVEAIIRDTNCRIAQRNAKLMEGAYI